MGDLSIAAEELLRGLGGAGVTTEGDFEALIRMEVTFARKKGEYYACYEFGTAITPDSDQMKRIDRDAGDGAPSCCCAAEASGRATRS